MAFRSFSARPTPRQKPPSIHFSDFLNGLTECDDTEHRHRYFDNESFGTKFKAFHNLEDEWEAWMQVENF